MKVTTSYIRKNDLFFWCLMPTLVVFQLYRGMYTKTTFRGLRYIYIYMIRVVVFNTFNIISVISWWSVLLVEEAGVLGENHRPVTSH
jgi:hypothetical protein